MSYFRERKAGMGREYFTEEMGAEKGLGGWVGFGMAEKPFQTRLYAGDEKHGCKRGWRQ